MASSIWTAWPQSALTVDTLFRSQGRTRTSPKKGKRNEPCREIRFSSGPPPYAVRSTFDGDAVQNASMPDSAIDAPGGRGPASDLLKVVLGAPLVAPSDDDSDDGGPEGRRFSVYDDIRTPPERRSLRQLPSLVRGA